MPQYSQDTCMQDSIAVDFPRVLSMLPGNKQCEPFWWTSEEAVREQKKSSKHYLGFRKCQQKCLTGLLEFDVISLILCEPVEYSGLFLKLNERETESSKEVEPCWIFLVPIHWQEDKLQNCPFSYFLFQCCPFLCLLVLCFLCHLQQLIWFCWTV